MMRRSLNFSKINAAALPALPTLCARWLPGGKRIEPDANGVKVNLQTGRWADFATADAGGDAEFSFADALHVDEVLRTSKV